MVKKFRSTLYTLLFSIFVFSSASYSKNQIFVITGASGHVGNALVAEMLKAYKTHPRTKIRALTFSLDKIGALKEFEGNPQLEIMQADILDPNSLAHAFAGATSVIHLAAQISINKDDEQLRQMQRVNVTGTQNVLESAYAAGVRYFIHCASSHAYVHRTDRPLSVDNGLVDFSPKADITYDMTKAEGVHKVREFAKAHDDFHYVIVAPAGVIGRYDHPETDMWPIFERQGIICYAPIPDGGYAFVDIVQLSNLMQIAHKKLLSRPSISRIVDRQEFMIAGQVVKIKDFFQALQSCSGKTHCLNLPPWSNSPATLPLSLLQRVAPICERVAAAFSRKSLITEYSMSVLGSLPKGVDRKELKKIRYRLLRYYRPVALQQTFRDRYAHSGASN